VDALTTAELAGMQGTAQESMMDTCVIQAWSGEEADDYGQLVETWTDGSPVACGFNPRGGREVPGPSSEPLLTDATVRLPLGTAVDRRDRVTVTHRFGAALAVPLVFDVVQEPRRGPSGLQLDLRRAEL